MTVSRRLEVAKTCDENSSGQSNVLQPLVNRWLPDWVTAFRRSRAQQVPAAPGSDIGTGTVHYLDTSNAKDVDHAPRLENLRQQETALLADFALWTERYQSAEVNFGRASEQAKQARHRLAHAGESVPDKTTDQLSALQESYQNFAMGATLHEQKLAQAKQKVSLIQENRARLVAEMLALSDYSTACELDEVAVHQSSTEIKNVA